MRLVVFTEEQSMQVTLEALLPRLGLAAEDYQIVTFDGVRDLERSLTRRLRRWQDPRARFLILRDNDRGDCKRRKMRLQELVDGSGNRLPAKIRIVVQELEAWFLGDITALEQVGLLRSGRRPSVLRQDPESHGKPMDVLRQFDRTYQKNLGAKRIAPNMRLDDNTCRSFHATIKAIRELMELDGA